MCCLDAFFFMRPSGLARPLFSREKTGPEMLWIAVQYKESDWRAEAKRIYRLIEIAEE
jgi:hypothetical protein